MRDLIVSTINVINLELEKKVAEEIEKKVEQKLKEKTEELKNRLAMFVYENWQLKEEVGTLKNSAEEALQRSNYNEQYSMKNNVKIMGIA